MEEKEKDGSLYNYIFHYNHFKDKWYAIPRNQYKEYFNGIYTNCIEEDTVEGILTKVFIKETTDNDLSNN